MTGRVIGGNKNTHSRKHTAVIGDSDPPAYPYIVLERVIVWPGRLFPVVLLSPLASPSRAFIEDTLEPTL